MQSCENRDYIASLMRLYAVTDRDCVQGRDFFQVLRDVLSGGASLVQLREKKLQGASLLSFAIQVRDMCREFGIPLIVNDDVHLAKEIQADGVHLGQSDMDIRQARSILGDGVIIGISAHDKDEALEAEEAGADYLGLGAVFATGTKSDVNIMSFDTLVSITRAVKIPTCAIGGINAETIDSLWGSGIDGVAIVSALFASKNPQESTRNLLDISEKLFGKSEKDNL